MPGGTFFEIARRRASVAEYMEVLRSLGFNAVEISDGTFPLTHAERQEAIACAAEAGLAPFAEFGKKAAHFRAERDALLRTLEEDVRAGAHYVIVEARESGTVGVFDENGKIDISFVRELTEAAGEASRRLIWEAPPQGTAGFFAERTGDPCQSGQYRRYRCAFPGNAAQGIARRHGCSL
jgi:phosphosulfolactate synthase